jgi:hypothetical protein
MLERQNQTRVIRFFPHEQSLLRLIAVSLMETNQEWMGRIYLSTEEETGQPPTTRTNYPEEWQSTEHLGIDFKYLVALMGIEPMF